MEDHMSNTFFIIASIVLWTLAFVMYRADKRRKQK